MGCSFRLFRQYFVVAVLAGAAPGAFADSAVPRNEFWRPAKQSAIDLPHGDPFTQPLALCERQRRLIVRAISDQLRGMALAEAALEVGATEPRHASHCLAELEQICQAAGRNREFADEAALSQAIHQALYRRLLRRYDASASNVADVFLTGKFNCVSGTILFVAIAQELGMNVHAVELPGHVRAIVELPKRRLEIEITSPEWNAAARWRDGAASDGGPKTTDRWREVQAPGLLAMLYFNRGVDAIEGEHFAEAVAMNRLALDLDPANRLARGNLLAAVNNWALALAAAGHTGDAHFLLSAGQKFDPTHTPFSHNAAYLRQREGQ